MYIYEHKEWPNFIWDQIKIADLLTEVRYLQGRLLGRMDALSFPLREEATLQIFTQDVLKTSEIEDEKPDPEQVRSAIAKRLGIDIDAMLPVNRDVEGIVEVMLDATRAYDKPLTEERLFRWHAALFPMRHTEGWRTEGGDQAGPACERLPNEMTRFIKWFNAPSKTDLVIKSALAYFGFVTIHPFDDGNGRMARALADMMLARAEKSSQRFYSLSGQIQRERNAYDDVLERCQKGSLNITPWIEWFLHCLKRSIASSQETLQAVLTKSRFWNLHAGEAFNERQQFIVNCLLDGLDGKLNSSRWATLAKCSQDTALRDINDLLGRKILVKEDAGGRSTGYQICLP